MSTPLYSVSVRAVFPRGAVLDVSPMAADPAQESLTPDLALQLLLEGHRAHRLRPPAPDHAQILDELEALAMPRSLTLAAGDPLVERIVASGQHDGRALLSVKPSSPAGDQVVVHLERAYRALCGAAVHYIYYLVPVETSPAIDEHGSSITLSLAVRFPWLVGSLAPGLHWESTVYSFARYT